MSPNVKDEVGREVEMLKGTITTVSIKKGSIQTLLRIVGIILDTKNKITGV